VVLRCRENLTFLANIRLDDEVHKDVLSAVAGYDKVVIVEKHSCCGGPEVQAALWELCWQRWECFPNVLTACGVNTEACVAETVNWLAEVGFEVIVVKDACNTSVARKHSRQLKKWQGLKNIKVV